MDDFNPYHKWFGIPTSNVSPNHYQILGLTVLEDDPDVIESAVEQRLLFLRSVQNGPHGALAQDLANKVMGIRSIILNPEKKELYDAELAKQIQKPTQAAGFGATPPPSIATPPPLLNKQSHQDSSRNTSGATAPLPRHLASGTSSGAPVSQRDAELPANAPTSEGPNAKQQADAAPVIREKTSSAVSTRSSRSKRTAKPNNIAIQFAIFFVPTMLLVVFFIIFPQSFRNTVYTIRSLVYGNAADNDEELPSKKSEVAAKTKKRPTKQRSPDRKPKQSDPQARSSNQQNKGNKATTDNTQNDIAERTAKSNSPSPKIEEAVSENKNNSLLKEMNEVDVAAVKKHRLEFESLKESTFENHLSWAAIEPNKSKKLAHYEEAISIAAQMGSIGNLVHAYSRMENAELAGWEQGFAQPILKLTTESSTVQSLWMIYGLAPEMIRNCRLEGSVSLGIEFCERLQKLTNGEKSHFDQSFLTSNLAILNASKQFDAQAENSDEKLLFESLFRYRATDLPVFTSAPYQKLKEAIGELESHKRLGFKQTEEVEKQFKHLTVVADVVSRSAANKAIDILLDEYRSDLRLQIKNNIIEGAIRNKDGKLIQPDLSELQLHPFVRLAGKHRRATGSNAMLFPHTIPLAFSDRIEYFDFSGSPAYLFVRTSRTNDLIAPLTRNHLQTNQRTRLGLAVGPVASYQTTYPQTYMHAFYEYPRIVITDGRTGKVVVQVIPDLELSLGPRRSPIQSALANSNIKQIAVLGKDNQTIVLQGQSIAAIVPSAASKKPLKSNIIQTDVELPIGLVSNNNDGGLAVIGEKEVVNFLKVKELRPRIALDSQPIDADYANDGTAFFVCTDTEIVRKNGGKIQKFPFANAVRIEAIDEQTVIVIQTLENGEFSLKLLDLDSGIPVILQELIAPTSKLCLSHDNQFVALQGDNAIQLYSVLWVK